jgi:hypothetical protein
MCDAWLMVRPSLLSHISLLLRSPSLWVIRELVTACPHAPLCPSPSVSVTSGAQLCQDHTPGWRRSPRCALPVQLNQSSNSYSLPVRSLCRSSPIGLLFQHIPVSRRFDHEPPRLRTAMCLPSTGDAARLVTTFLPCSLLVTLYTNTTPSLRYPFSTPTRMSNPSIAIHAPSPHLSSTEHGYAVLFSFPAYAWCIYSLPYRTRRLGYSCCAALGFAAVARLPARRASPAVGGEQEWAAGMNRSDGALSD